MATSYESVSIILTRYCTTFLVST